MSHFTHLEPFKEPLHRERSGLIQLGFILVSSLVLLILFIPMFARAQQPCGDIITEYDGQDERTPIEHCNDPFDVGGAPLNWDFTLTLNGTTLTDDESREVEMLPVNINLDGVAPNQEYYDFSSVVYRHEEGDYRYVGGTSYGGEGIAITATGTYSIVSTLDFNFPILSKNKFQSLFASLVPVAHAQVTEYVGYAREVLTFTLDVVEPEPVPTGASNILFIPGIMGSRLYEESSECEGELGEQERWVSFDSCDQLRLKTNYLGQSLNTIYTYPTESALVDEITLSLGQGPNIYKSLLVDLEDWKENENINEYAVLPYDWRLKIDDLMTMSRDLDTNKIVLDSDVDLNQSYLYETISRLAQSAQNEKVTVVAHSNGGLLIKYFVKILAEQNDPLLDRIENIILVAVPQEGTSESIIGSLHGVELGYDGIVMDSQTSRTLMKDAPFGYHLLPTRQYFDSVETPVILIEVGLETNDWRQQFGDILNSYDEMRAFMSEESSRTEPSETDVATPAVLNNNAFTYKSSLESVLANWQPPEGVNVYQVAGTGLDTPSGITYFTDVACAERNIFFQCTRYEQKLGYRVNGVLDGDGTVVTASALSMSEGDNVERMWVDLGTRNNDSLISIVHRDIMEIEDIRNLVLDIATSSTDPVYEYLSVSSPSLGNGDRLIFQLHSPLDMYLDLGNGVIVGSSSEIVGGAMYRRFGEVQYISVPASEEDIVLRLEGRATGSFTLDIEQANDGEVYNRQTYSAIPTATSTKVEILIGSVSDVENILLEVDFDGNGETDVSYNTEGVIEEVVTYEDLFTAIKELTLNKNFEKVLLGTAKSSEKFYEKSLTQAKYKRIEELTLHVLMKQLEVYEKIKVITKAQREAVGGVVNNLINK